jgi:hypothetical protein
MPLSSWLYIEWQVILRQKIPVELTMEQALGVSEDNFSAISVYKKVYVRCQEISAQ